MSRVKRVLLVSMAAMTLAVFATGSIASAAPLTCPDKGNPAEVNKGGQCK